MSVQDNRHHIPGAGRLPSWRWLSAVVWWIEHAFERARAQSRPEEDTRVRIFLIIAFFGLIFTVLALAAGYRALLTDPVRVGAMAHPNAVVRADLTDRNGQLLATNIVHYGLYIDPAEVWDREQAYAQIRRVLPRVPEARLRQVLYGDRRMIVLPGLTPQEKVGVHDLALGGVSFEPEDRRIYPLNGVASHVVGFSDTGGMGIEGAERAFNAEIREAGLGGESFPLSIDLRVQGVVESELAAAAEAAQAKGAVAIVTDASTGEVLGMASWPSFDVNHRGSASADAMRNRVTQSVYEMGSVFKTFTVAAALDTGRADMNTTLDASRALTIGSRRITDFHAQNRVMTLEEVYLHSSNIGTSRLALDMGAGTMRRYLDGFGLLQAAPIELPSADPITPREWSDSTLASLSFGYGASITPAQMAAAMSVIANDGRYVPLTLRRGRPVDPSMTRQVISSETAASMRELMRRNVVRGSGTRAEAPGLRVAGKTGSANKLVGGRYSSQHGVGSFAAVFPADGPPGTRRYVIFVLVDEPGVAPRTGGFVAAPAVGRIADRIAPFLGVERRDDAYRTALGDRVPVFEDVEGDGL